MADSCIESERGESVLELAGSSDSSADPLFPSNAGYQFRTKEKVTAMGIGSSLSCHLDIFGVGGVLAECTNRLIHFPREMSVRPKGIRSRVFLRPNTTDTSTYRQNLVAHEYDFNLPFEPRTILDAGANIGMASVYFANRYPSAMIVAIEPEPSNFRMLEKNVAAYPFITAIRAALWPSEGQVSVVAPSGMDGSYGHWGFSVSEGTGTPAMTVLAIMRRVTVDRIDLLKIDIEGAELELFSGDCEWLKHVRCVMIETHDRFRPGCAQAVHSVLGAPQIEKGETSVFCLS
jgi:FkbM family methyltransferase